jgi:DNA-binding transcriptional LysR family regulator
MRLSSNQLEAFYEAAQTLNFSRAAKNLHITQSALSQRILNLESQLELSLFVRDSSGMRLTDSGHALLRHCQVQRNLEEDLLNNLKAGPRKGVAGTLRVGGYSSVLWSVIVPALGDFVRKNRAIRLEFFAREMGMLPAMLRRGEIDFAILDHEGSNSDIECHFLGTEEALLVEPKTPSARTDIFLDHDMDDQTTIRFFQNQGVKKPKLERAFVDDVHGLVAAASQGWGSVVLPRHLIDQCRNIRIKDEYKPLQIPVYLHYYVQPYYAELHEKVVEILKRDCAKILSGK